MSVSQVELLHCRRPQLLVATPGRLLDLVDSAVLNFDLTNCVVLDEADKMLSVGFEPQLQRLQALLLGNKAGPAAAAGAAASKGDKKKGKAAKRQQEQAAGSAGQQCQVLLFSATLPKAVRVTADAWLKAGYESVSCSAGADSISRSITQVGPTHVSAVLCGRRSLISAHKARRGTVLLMLRECTSPFRCSRCCCLFEA